MGLPPVSGFQLVAPLHACPINTTFLIMKITRTPTQIATFLRIAGNIRRAMLISAATLVSVIPATVSSDPIGMTSPLAYPTPAKIERPAAARFADFGHEATSVETRHIADWIADSGDNKGADFVIVDKKFARIHVFDSAARLLGTSPVLLGAARGDDAVPGIGTRPIEQVRPAERTTHAGRFVGERGRNTQGEDIVWVDYDAAVSMHRVRSTNTRERRLERLATATVDDNRISYGCINIPVAFYETHIHPVFAARNAVIYVLPEVKSLPQVFGSYDVASRLGRKPELSGHVPDLAIRQFDTSILMIDDGGSRD